MRPRKSERPSSRSHSQQPKKTHEERHKKEGNLQVGMGKFEAAGNIDLGKKEGFGGDLPRRDEGRWDEILRWIYERKMERYTPETGEI